MAAAAATRCLALMLLASQIVYSQDQFKVPDVTIQALNPRGFRVFIEGHIQVGLWSSTNLYKLVLGVNILSQYDEHNVMLSYNSNQHHAVMDRRITYHQIFQNSLFTFQGRLNKPISETDLGEISGEVTAAKNGRWIYEDPYLKLKIGVVINYYVFVYHRKGYVSDPFSHKGTGELTAISLDLSDPILRPQMGILDGDRVFDNLSISVNSLTTFHSDFSVVDV